MVSHTCFRSIRHRVFSCVLILLLLLVFGCDSSDTRTTAKSATSSDTELQLRITSPTDSATVAYFVDKEGNITSQTTFTAATSGGTAPVTVTWLVEGSTSSTSATGDAVVIVPSPLEAGSHKVTAVAEDAAGLTSSETITVTITLP